MWTQLFLKKGKTCVATLLGRAKGSTLDVVINSNPPVGTTALLSSHVRQIRYLEFPKNTWKDIISFSGISSGPLPLLRNLKVTPRVFGPPGQLTPSSRLFGGATNLEEFFLNSNRLQLLSHFIFPNLTTFELSTSPVMGPNLTSLLDFFKSSPMLQKVDMKVTGGIKLDTVPQEAVVVLPNVRYFSLRIRDGIYSTGAYVYNLATFISCPYARQTSLVHDSHKKNMTPNSELFPAPTPWSAIVRQYTTSPAELVMLEIEFPEDVESMTCYLKFISSEVATVTLGFEVHDIGFSQDVLGMSLEGMGCKAFSQAHRFIRSHPQLSHIKRLHTKYRALIEDYDLVLSMADAVGKLFGSMGPLDELFIEGCDIRVHLGSILDLPDFDSLDQPIAFPSIKELALWHPSIDGDDVTVDDLDAIVDLAQSQHALGIPFEWVQVYAGMLPEGMAGRLRQWVDVVDCNEDCL